MKLFTLLAVLSLTLHSPPVEAGWTGIRFFVGDPAKSWNGTSNCAPCNDLCADLAEHATGTTWRIGFSETRRDGTTNHIQILRALPDEATPYYEYVRDGQVVGSGVGYRGDPGEIGSILSKYPGPMTRRTAFVDSVFRAYNSDYRASRVYQSSTYWSAPYRGANYFVPPQENFYRGVCVNGVCR